MKSQLICKQIEENVHLILAEASLHQFYWKLVLQGQICQIKLQMFFKSLYNFALPCILHEL